MPSIFRTLFLSLFSVCLLITACSPAPAPRTATAPATPSSQPSPTVSTDCAAGTHVAQLTSSGETRQYRLYVPESYQPDKPTALVLGFHGNTSHADVFEAFSGFSRLAASAGFIAAYPQGAGEPPTWNVWHNSTDVQFVSDLIDHLQTICNIDPKRIYVTGHSLGGGMTHRLACDLADRIAAIGAVSGAYVNAVPCEPARPVAVLAIHGTADTDVYYSGMPPNGDTPQTYFSIGTPISQWASGWAERNGCAAKSSIVFKKDPISGQQWSNCQGEVDVIFYTVRGGQHGWPKPTTDFDTAQVIWDFFVKHARTE